MHIPSKHTNGYKVMVALYQHGPMTIERLMSFVTKLSKVAVERAMSRLMSAKVTSREKYTYSLNDRVIRYLDGCVEIQAEGMPQIVPPRVTNVYASPALSSKYQISVNGMREGSNDFRNWPSHYGRAS